MLDGSSVDMWAKGELVISRLAESEPVEVGNRVGQVNEGRWVRFVPE